MSHSLQICTCRWHLTNINDFTRPVCWIWIWIYLILLVFWNFYLFLPFNIWVKSAIADFVLLNSVIVQAKFLVAVSKLFEVSEPFHSNIKQFLNFFKFSPNKNEILNILPFNFVFKSVTSDFAFTSSVLVASKLIEVAD